MDFPIVDGVEFRAIEGFDGYCVGDDGSVWSRQISGGRGRLGDVWKQRRPGAAGSGYLYVPLASGGRRCETKNKYVHRLVLAAFVGPCPDGMQGCHNDGNKRNNAIGNLRWDTSKNNHLDRIGHGTHCRGDRQGGAKLTWEKVREIRTIASNRSMSHGKIGKMFGVSQTNISMIVRNATWRELATA